MGTMASLRTALLFVSLAALPACHTASVADLAKNDTLYRFTTFVTKLPGDRAVFVAPVVEARSNEVLPAAQNGFPIAYDSDERWARQVTDMIDDVLRVELAQSRVFDAILAKPAADQLVLQPSLVGFSSGMMETDSGGRTLAEIGLRVQVFAPADADGKRAVLLDQIYGERQVSAPAMVPPSTYFLCGRALRITMQRLLAGLDGSNCGRTNVPLLQSAGR